MTQQTQAVSMLHAQRHFKPAAEAQNYYLSLLQKLSVPAKVSSHTREAREALMLWNGYYALDTASGAYFAIDANMVVTPAQIEPYLDISLIVSLDGKHAARFPFDAGFDGKTLKQADSKGLDIELRFTRHSEQYGVLASCTGTIRMPGGQLVKVSGETYNNPIQANLFAGTYYVSSQASTPQEVLKISANYQLSYDYESGDGRLNPVPAYVYNMNMYYFLIPQTSQKNIHLIMGTAGNKGFACNAMADASARALLTIPDAPAVPPDIFGFPDAELMHFSGYYPLTYANGPDHCTSAGFVSIQAQYSTWMPGLDSDCNMVLISWSFDGIHSRGQFFNQRSMHYSEGVLTIPEHGIRLSLKRTYDAANNALVKMEGKIGETSISAYTPFNPVPLTAFGGLALKNMQDDKLVIQSGNCITYNGRKQESLIYVPLMYILAYPALFTDTVMSLGTDGTHGTACIVTTNVMAAPQTTAVWSLPPA